MKKAQLVEIAQQAFYVEEAAYKKLHTYLEDITAYFADDAEVTSDIETSIAEKLHAKAGDKSNVVTEQDVETVIEQLGSVADITGSEQASSAHSEEPETGRTGPRQLYRDGDDAIIGGVASGIAHYFNIDPVIVRIVFLVTTFMYGASAFVYFILWLVVPMAETIEQKQTMRGSTTTLKDIEQSAKEKASQLRDEHGATVQTLAQRVVHLFWCGFVWYSAVFSVAY